MTGPLGCRSPNKAGLVTRWRLYARLLPLLVLLPSTVLGGGYLLTVGGNPRKWTVSPGTPITVNCDLGTLGSLSNASAVALVNTALSPWTNSVLSSSNVAFTQGAQLSTDNANGNTTAPDYTGVPGGTAGPNPIIFDSQGLLIDNKLGAGQRLVVVGFAGPTNWTFDVITRGRAVLNGLFQDGAGSPPDITLAQFQGVITHEMGHFLDMDHAQCNDAFVNSLTTPVYAGYPTMYPIVHTNMENLQADDKAWISKIYPSASAASLTSIQGTVRNSAGTALDGVNIIARRVDTGLGVNGTAFDAAQVITCCSGYTDTSGGSSLGEYTIPSIPQGSKWVLNFEQIRSLFTGGSRVGPINTPLILPGAPEYINESGQESNSDSLQLSTTFVTPLTAGGAVTGADLILNPVASITTVTEVDNGTDPDTGYTPLNAVPGVPLEVTGSIDPAESGTGISFGESSVEDWYLLNPAAALKVRGVTVTPSAGTNVQLLLGYSNASATLTNALVIDNGGNGAAESMSNVAPFISTKSFGSGAGAGKVWIGVNAKTGTSAGSYLLHVDADAEESDSAVVAGTSTGTIDPNTGSVTVTGRGFRNLGGAPTVTFSDPNIQVNSVTYVDGNTLNVNVTRGAGFVAGFPTAVQVTNQPASGGDAGRTINLVSVPVNLSAVELE